MSRLIKVTFTSTSEEETTGFATLHKDEMVELPKRMALRVSAAVDAGDGYALVAQHRGEAVPMVHVEEASYRLDMQHAISEPWSKRIAEHFAIQQRISCRPMADTVTCCPLPHWWASSVTRPVPCRGRWGTIGRRRCIFERRKVMFGPFVLVVGLGIAGFFLWVLRNADRARRLRELDRNG